MGPSALDPNTTVAGRFRIEAALGAGGLGELYRAVDEETGASIALRILAAEIAQSRLAMEQLRSQVQIAARLDHKNVARVFGLGKHGPLRYIASEYVDGQSVRALMQRKQRAGGSFTFKAAYNVIAHACNALNAAHDLDVEPRLVHGLPGPGAMLVSRTGRLKLCDFGYMRAIPAGTETIGRAGDYFCMAPEAQQDPMSAGPAADIYTLGIVLYALLTGLRPGSPYQPISAIVPGIPPSLDDIVCRCIDTVPRARYSSALQLKAAVFELLQATPPQVSMSEPAAPITPVATIPDATVPTQASAVARAPIPDPVVTAEPSYSAPISPTNTGPVARNSSAHQKQAPEAAAPYVGWPAGGAQGMSSSSGPPERSLEDMLNDPGEDNSERWLIRKDRLDFGPFSAVDLKQRMYRGEFTVDAEILDQETGQRSVFRMHPQFQQIAMLLERNRLEEAAKRTAADAERHAKRRRTIVAAITVIIIAVIGAAGTVFYLKSRNRATSEKIVYRDRPGPTPGAIALKGIDISWNEEPAAQAKKRRLLGRKRSRKGKGRYRRKRTGAADDDVTYLGDASKAGGDELLTQAQIQSVMQRHVQVLAPCVLQQARRQPSLRRVAITFGVRGSGKTTNVKVNGQSEGEFYACIAAHMQRIQFPKYDGSLTRASFAMNLKY